MFSDESRNDKSSVSEFRPTNLNIEIGIMGKRDNKWFET